MREDVQCFLVRACRSIGAAGGDGIESVGHSDDAGAKRDIRAGKAIGIAVAIHPLVMVADHGGDLGVPDSCQHVCTVARVALDDCEFRTVESPWIVEDLSRGVELAHVVDRGRGPDLGDLDRRDVHCASDTLGVARNPLAMSMGVGIARFEQFAETFK